MTIPHLINIVIHASAGVLAMLVGFYLLSQTKGTLSHRKLGRVFCYLGLVVCGAAALGLVAFRFLPLFAVITLLVSYQLIGGWRAIYTQDNGPTKYDATLTLLTVLAVYLIAPVVLNQVTGSKVIVLSTFGALAFVLIYDSLRWFFPKAWHKVLWRYEHSYKLLSSLFGMLSSFVGNTVRAGQPWSQIIPSVVGVICIGYFFYKLFVEDRKEFRENKNA